MSLSSHPGHDHSHDHGHAHHHNHSHDHSHSSTVEHNEVYFDELTEKHESVRTQPIVTKSSQQYLTLPAVLVYIGMRSHEIAPYVKSVVVVDISKGSIGIYNCKDAEAGAANKMSPVALDFKGTPGELDVKKFGSTMVYYRHFDSPQAYTKMLMHYFNQGCKFLVADLMPNTVFDTPNVSENMSAAIPHTHGIAESTMMEMFEGAGLVDVKCTKVWQGPAPVPDTNIPEEEPLIDVFLAEATKPTLEGSA